MSAPSTTAVASDLANLSVSDKNASADGTALAAAAGATQATPAPTMAGFAAVLDIEDLHYVSIVSAARLIIDCTIVICDC